ncbi:unnamed protein product [Kuraishia capsulata CBS 1993]|uniref:OPA3-like protein n=1 Tax=Kuraishia capsulata CBS 1993 TaxID=1382522 RepID=W6MVU0_9ASCO|nr:uncharacterized protein KUCA_T00002497001 [Kuraishia capsulata CBS 1993]CDK26525.1 unnamed protein product [Kuraishia capsulata CBS 1993]
MSSIAFKLATLFVRTVAKPIAATLKVEAKQYPMFKKVCVNVAQNMHILDTRLRMKLLGKKNVTVRPLNENKAIESGASFLSEAFIFSVASSAILYESYRSRKKELTRRESVADDIATLQDEIEYLKRKLEEYNMKLDDYHPPEDMKPTVLKLDEHGKNHRNGDLVVAKVTEAKPEESTISTKKDLPKGFFHIERHQPKPVPSSTN